MTKLERTRHKLASLIGYFKKEPSHFIWNRDEALACMAETMLYLLFLIEENGINIHNPNDRYKED